MALEHWIPLLHWVGENDWNWSGVEVSRPTPPIQPALPRGRYLHQRLAPVNGAITRSTDRGRTFKRTELPFKLGGNEPGRSMGERLVIDPRDGTLLLWHPQ